MHTHADAVRRVRRAARARRPIAISRGGADPAVASEQHRGSFATTVRSGSKVAMYSPSEDSESEDTDDGALDRTYSGDDDAFQTDEVILVQQLEETRRAAEEYLQTVGFPNSTAAQLAQRLLKPVDAVAIPEVCSDLIDKHGGGASPGMAPARPSDAPSAVSLGDARRPPTPQVLAADVAEQVCMLLDSHASLQPRLDAATTSKALAVVMQTHPEFHAAIVAAAKQLEQRYSHDGLPPSRSIMAEAYEIVVANRRVAAVDRFTNIKAAKAGVFFAGVILSRIQPSDTPSTLLLPCGRGGKTTMVPLAPAPGDQLVQKLQSRSGGGSTAFGTASSLADFESDLAHALALSQEEARGGPADESGRWSAGGFASAGGIGAGIRATTIGGEDYELQAALAASVSAVGAALSTPAREDEQLSAALAASLAPLGSLSGARSDSAPGDSEDDELARALALSMGEQTPCAEDTRATVAEAQYGVVVGELMSMGFDKASVLQALEASGGDQEGAADILLG